MIYIYTYILTQALRKAVGDQQQQQQLNNTNNSISNGKNVDGVNSSGVRSRAASSSSVDGSSNSNSVGGVSRSDSVRCSPQRRVNNSSSSASNSTAGWGLSQGIRQPMSTSNGTSNIANEDTTSRPCSQHPLNITGGDIRKLLMKQPELSEYLYLEIQNMKVESNERYIDTDYRDKQ